MITYSVESLRDCLDELKPMFVPHWEELGLNKDKVPLAPQYSEYLRRDSAGGVLTVLAREQGRVFAYFVGFIAPGLHYSTCLTLTMDIFWLHPDFRDGDSLSQIEGGMVVKDLFDAVKKEAQRRGVQRAFFGSKVHRDASMVFESIGMEEVERYYSAWWGD